MKTRGENARKELEHSRSKETREFRQRLESLKTRSKRKYPENFGRRSTPLERDQRFRKILENLEPGASRSKGTREFQKKEQTARKRLENFDRD